MTRDLKTLAALALAVALAGCPSGRPTTEPAPGPLPSASLYHLGAGWRDQTGERRDLASLRGDLVVMTMMFTSCEYACPRIVADLRAIEAALPPGAARFVMASFDAERDLPDVLREYARAQALPAPRWTLLHGEADLVRELGAALGISYQKTQGGFAHGNVIVALDRDGVPIARVEGLGADPTALVAAIVSATR